MGLSEVVDSLGGLLPWRNRHRYSAIPVPREQQVRRERGDPSESVWSGQNRKLLKLSAGALLLVILLYMATAFG
jgi:hypothetical protein